MSTDTINWFLQIFGACGGLATVILIFKYFKKPKFIINRVEYDFLNESDNHKEILLNLFLTCANPNEIQFSITSLHLFVKDIKNGKIYGDKPVNFSALEKLTPNETRNLCYTFVLKKIPLSFKPNNEGVISGKVVLHLDAKKIIKKDFAAKSSDFYSDKRWDSLNQKQISKIKKDLIKQK